MATDPDISNPKQLPQEEKALELEKYLFGIMANWYWFLLSIFLGVSISWLVNRYSMPVYKVTGSLIISDNTRGNGLTGYENLIPGMEIYRNQKAVLNEIEILKSFAIAQRTLLQLDFNISYMGVGRSGFKEAVLYNSCPFIVIPDNNKKNYKNYPIYVDIKSKTTYEITIDDNFNIKKTLSFGEKFESPDFNFTIVLRDSLNFSSESVYSKYYFVINSQNKLVNLFKNKIGIGSNDQKRGSVLFLSMSGNNPQQISEYLNKLMEVYINMGLEEKNQTAINTVNFIDQQLAILDTSLRIAEMDLQNFRLQNKLINSRDEGTMVSTKLVDLETQKAMLGLQERYYLYLQDYVNDKNNLNQVVAPSILNISDPLLSQLIFNLNNFIAEKEELLFTVQPGNPNITLIDSKIETLRNALSDNIISLLKNNSLSQAEINSQLNQAEKELERFPVTERLLISIQRQYKVNDQIYTYLLQKRAESAIVKAANVSDNKILDSARVENALLISPQRKTNTIIGLLVGVLFPLILLILLDLLINKITSRSDIERRTAVPIISSIGHSSNSGEIPVFEIPKSALAESFRGLRTNLQFMLREKEQKVLTITSTISGEGKTFCSTNLAAIFAMAGKKTLLVGLDLRKPKVHKIFNIDNSIGVSTCLIGKTSLKDIVKASKIDNLFVAPSGPVPPNPAELLESQAMSDFINQARKTYDIIILDTPPFGMVTDARLISRFSDLTLFILRQNYSTLNILDLLEEVYKKKEIGQMGLIINDIRNKGYYGYGYRYYNYGSDYHYGYYYTYGNYHEDKS